MDDVLSLRGAAVRDQSGRVGRVVSSTLGDVSIGWEIPGVLLPQEEKILRSDKRLGWYVEVLSFDAGWVPLGVFAAAPAVEARTHVRADELRADIDEATKHYPFTHKANLGPGPRGREHKERNKWACRCSNYVCVCRGEGGKKKRINVDADYKAAYNREYKRWRRKKDG